MVFSPDTNMRHIGEDHLVCHVTEGYCAPETGPQEYDIPSAGSRPTMGKADASVLPPPPEQTEVRAEFSFKEYSGIKH